MVDQNQAESSSASKLKVKLMIQKTMSIDQQLQIDSSNTKNHVCKQCNRSFSSGKALGGHMSSAHVQAQANYKDLSLEKKQLLKSKKKTNTAFGCTICNRLFHSRKSLFGHMKSHPDRHWRGMDPPQDKSQDSFAYDDLSYSAEDEDNGEEFEEEKQVDLRPVMDLSASLTGWGVKGKRGRQDPDSEPDEDQNELHATVHQLIRLVNSPVPKKVEVVAKYRACGSGPVPEKMVVCENVQSMENSMSISAGDQDGVVIVSKAKRAKVNGSDEKTRSSTIQAKELDSPTPTSNPGNLFKCNICGKGFSTYQGLGGHRSSHNKPRVSIYHTIDEVNTNKFRSSSTAKTARGYANVFGSGVPNGQVYNTVPSKDHQANVVLDRVPYNGQATFGNESTQGISSVDMVPYGSQATFENRSTQGSTADRVSSSEQATSAARRTQESKRVLLNLNEFPDEDEI